MTFREAVEATAAIAASFADGLQALSEVDRGRLTISYPRRLRGSVNIDDALRGRDPKEFRWDYGIGLGAGQGDEHALWIEVHSANSLHIDTVVKKRRWLRQWLDTEGAAMKEITPRSNYVWLASGSVALPKDSPQRKRLAMEGIGFRSKRLNLDEFLPGS